MNHQKSKKHFAVIMAGGIGSRFWPLSRNQFPKQFLDILGTGKSLLQMTFDRLAEIIPVENILIVSHVDYEQLVLKQLPTLLKYNLISEPERKNTAPCVALATQLIIQRNPDAIILTAPADHLILQEAKFIQDINEGFEFLENYEGLLTLGINASRPDTGYGYIHYNQEFEQGHNIFPVRQFVEKPNYNKALEYIESGDYVWNSGMFLWKASTIWSAFIQYNPQLASIFNDFQIENISSAYSQCESISIDYAIMEHADTVFVKKVDFGWSDLGTWGSIYTLLPHDTLSNATKSKKLLLYDVESSIVHNETNQIVVLQGLKDFIVVNTNDALLVCEKSEEQRIKQILKDVETSFGKEYV
ncbi:MAG: NTP transferase domain-containing protein [Saprospiraceae bacterium]|nr:NTP transferase domain-containing protein [Saprospiraceae bacterium]